MELQSGITILSTQNTSANRNQVAHYNIYDGDSESSMFHPNLDFQDAKNKNTDNKVKRIRTKDFCYYCENSVLNFARHIQRSHSTEFKVQQILSKPVKSKERKNLFTTLRKQGNYIQNVENVVKPMKKCTDSSEYDNYLPCIHCLGYYRRKQLWRHKKTCTENPKGTCNNLQSEAQNLLVRHIQVDKQLKESVFPRMRADKISLVAKKDVLICAFGAKYLKIHREKHFINVTSRKMRELAKLLIEIQKKTPAIQDLFNALRPQYYDLIVDAAKCVAKYNSEKDQYESPTLAMNINTR